LPYRDYAMHRAHVPARLFAITNELLSRQLKIADYPIAFP